MTTQQSNTELDVLSQAVNQNISKIFAEFNVKLSKNSKFYTGCCPVHRGDNNSAFNYFHNEDKRYKGSSWRCYTHKCHDVFKKSSLGLVRGLLSSLLNNWHGLGDKVISFRDTINWIKKFLGVTEGNEGTIEQTPWIPPEFNIPEPKLTLTKGQIRSILKHPPAYFLERGYSKRILDFYDVGLPTRPIPKYYFREFVPVYDNHNQYCIGAVARSIFEKCGECQAFHDPNFPCPEKEFRHFYCKWKNWEFDRAYSLYNLWHAADSIRRSGNIVLVEGQGNVWKMKEAGITNVVSSYGTELTWQQIELLRRSGANSLGLCMDNDKAGEIAFKVNGQKLWQDFNLYKVSVPQTYNDVGEMEIGNIAEIINPQINKRNRL
jgi:5S rRNA maturation endonuclease (ribonuclease M5)